ncbi:MAG: hypothetical protein IJG68_02455 [Bacilli bacterium]|nr:hypothetical protein [Bacilli bacterium]
MMNNILLVLVVLGLLFMLFSFSVKLGNFVDIRDIIKKHLSFFKSNKLQFISIYIVTIVFSLYIGTIHTINKELLDNMIIILSILISMFFAVLSILCSIDSKNKNDIYKQLLNETYTSTVFEIIICIVLLLISFAALFMGKGFNTIIDIIASDIIYYLTFVLILNIFVIIKRIEAIFQYRN